MIIRGLTKKIVVTRLVVGHTHADIDAKFAKIWMKIRNMHVLTAQHYEQLITSALKSTKHVSKVVDLLVIPDYALLLNGMNANKTSK